MNNRGIRRKMLRFVALTAFGGTVFQLGGCDPTVRSTVLTGLSTTTNSLADTLIAAFFASLNNNNAAGAGGFTTT